MRSYYAGNIPLSFSGPMLISSGGTSNVTAPTAINALVPDQSGHDTRYLITNGTYVLWGNAAGSVPAGLDKQLQYNNESVLSGSTALFDKLTEELTLSGDLLASGAVNMGSSANTFGNLYLNGLISFRAIEEKVVDIGNSGIAVISPDIKAGMAFRYTITGDITINSLTNVEAGSSVTLILTQDGIGGHTLTSSMLFAHGDKTLSVAPGAIDILNIIYDGFVYMASLQTNFH